MGEKLEVRKEKSDYQLQIIEHNFFFWVKQKTPLSKRDTSLKFRLQSKKIHRILKFKQKPYLRSNIENTIQICKE